MDMRFLAYEGGRCKGVRFVGWLVLSCGNAGGLALFGERLFGENCACCGEGDGECEGDITAVIIVIT